MLKHIIIGMIAGQFLFQDQIINSWEDKSMTSVKLQIVTNSLRKFMFL